MLFSRFSLLRNHLKFPHCALINGSKTSNQDLSAVNHRFCSHMIIQAIKFQNTTIYLYNQNTIFHQCCFNNTSVYATGVITRLLSFRSSVWTGQTHFKINAYKCQKIELYHCKFAHISNYKKTLILIHHSKTFYLQKCLFHNIFGILVKSWSVSAIYINQIIVTKIQLLHHHTMKYSHFYLYVPVGET